MKKQQEKLRKKIFLFILNILLAPALCAQVGINTNTPYNKSVFHIDAKGDNTSSTNVTDTQAADDIVVLPSGYVGVGTVDPTARLHIKTDSQTKPIRISDGSEGIGKYLVSDDHGQGSWKDKPIPYGVVYYSTTATNFPPGAYTPFPVEINPENYAQITIPHEGNYIVTLRWWGVVNSPPMPSRIVGGKIRLVRYEDNGAVTVLDETEHYFNIQALGTSVMRSSFTISLFSAGLESGDKLGLELMPLNNITWKTGYTLSPSQTSSTVYYPSIIVYNI